MNSTLPVIPNDPTMRATIKSLIDTRDDLWLHVANSARIDQGDLEQLRETNHELERLLRLTPGPTTPLFSPAVTRVELVRCGLCVQLIKHYEAETNNVRWPGNGAVVSAAKFFCDRQEPQQPPFDLSVSYGG